MVRRGSATPLPPVQIRLSPVKSSEKFSELFFRAKKNNDKVLRWMWLTIVLSFAFYIPVVLWADVVPMIGMLMIPKTCAYVWTVLIGYNAMKKEVA